MITGKAYIKIENIKNKNIIEKLLAVTFDKISTAWNDNVLELQVDECDSFKQKLINSILFQAQDMGIKYQGLIVPFFDDIFVKYLDYFSNEVLTAYELFIKRIDDRQVLEDLKTLYGYLSNRDIDMLKVYFNCNTNSSLAASELYLHRNSMNYRMNGFQNKLSIDMRDLNSIMFINLIIFKNS